MVIPCLNIVYEWNQWVDKGGLEIPLYLYVINVYYPVTSHCDDICLDNMVCRGVYSIVPCDPRVVYGVWVYIVYRSDVVVSP